MYGQPFNYGSTAQTGGPQSMFREISEHGRVADVPNMFCNMITTITKHAVMFHDNVHFEVTVRVLSLREAKCEI